MCSIMLVKTTKYKSSGISSANLLRALEIFGLPLAISPELNKYPGSNPVYIRFTVILGVEDQRYCCGLKLFFDEVLAVLKIDRGVRLGKFSVIVPSG